MPRHVVDLVAEALNDRGQALKGARVGVLGVAFKPNVRDARNSPAAAILAGLAARGAEVVVPRPARPALPRHGRRRARLDSRSRRSSAGSDVVVVVTAHRAIDWDAGLRARRAWSSTPSTARAAGPLASARSSGSAPAGPSGHERRGRDGDVRGRAIGPRDDPGRRLPRATRQRVHPRRDTDPVPAVPRDRAVRQPDVRRREVRRRRVGTSSPATARRRSSGWSS